MRRRKLFTFGLACAVVAALAAGSPFLASAASASGATAPAVAKPATAKTAAPASIKWGPWKRVVSSDAGKLSGLGCLTATHCFAWDVSGDSSKLVTSNGSAWSAPKAVKLAGGPWSAMADTSCPTSTFCVTVGGVGNAYVYSHGTWTSTKAGDALMQRVSCASPTFCAATSANGEVSEYNGKTWTAGVRLDDATHPVDDVSCVSADYCLLSTGGDAIFGWDGKSWTKMAATLTGAKPRLQVSCVSSTWCMAVDGGGDYWTYNGASWVPPFRQQANAGGEDLQCTSTTFCAMGVGGGAMDVYDGVAFPQFGGAFNEQGLPFGVSQVSCVGQSCVALAQVHGMVALADTYANDRWAGEQIVDTTGTLEAASCPTTTFCAAIGEGAYSVMREGMWVETWHHGTWAAPVRLPSAILANNYRGVPNVTLSCPSATFCLANQSYGPVWRYNGRAWAKIASPPSAAPGVTGVSCGSPTFCVATVTPSTNAKHKPTSSGLAVFNGSRWTAVKPWAGDTGTWDYATCANASFCMVSDAGNHFAVFNGKSGRQLASFDENLATSDHGAPSCTSASFCAMSQYWNDQTYPIRSGVDLFNGRSWTYHYLTSGGWFSGGVMGAVSCAPHSTFCLADTAAGHTFSFNGVRWTRTGNIGGGYGPFTACASAKLCLAINHPGGASIGT